MIRKENNLLLKSHRRLFKQCLIGFGENLSSFMGNQFVTQIKFVRKIQIKGSFCNTSPLYNI